VITATIEDGDGDTATATANIGDSFRFEDDGPSTYEPEDAELINEAGAPVFFDLDDPGQGGNDDIGDNFGKDGPGVVRFQSSLDETDSGMTSGTVKIWYFLNGDGTVLEGRTGVDAAAAASGTVIFTITIDQANDRYSVDMNGTVDNLGEVIFDDTLFDFIGGNKAWFGIVPNGQMPGDDPQDDNSQDVLITPLNNTSINTSGILGGVDTGQSVGAGEGFRLDYVVDLTGTLPNNYTQGAGAATNGHMFDSHWNTNGAFFIVRQSGGSDVRISAFDDDADSGTDGNTIVGDGDQELITKIVITYVDGDGNEFVSADLIPTGTEKFVTLDGIEFSYQLDGESVIVTNLQGATGANEIPSTQIAVFTEDGYTSLEIEHAGGETFKFAGFGAVTQLLEPVEFSVPTEIVDGDGDIVAGGDIDVILQPVGTILSLAPFEAMMSQEEQLQKTAANSNTLTLATAVAAAGFVEPVAAHDNGNHNGHGQNSDMTNIAAAETVERYSVSDDGGNAAVSMLAPEASTEASAPADTSSSSSSSDTSSSNSLDDSAASAAPESNDAPAADDGGSNSSAAAVGPVAPTVAMVSADALQAAANDHGNAQKGGSVEQIVAEALQHGASDVDAVLANLPGGNGGLQAIAHMASPDVAAVSGWHMAGHGAVGAGFDMMFKMDVVMHHQDAVQPVQNG